MRFLNKSGENVAKMQTIILLATLLFLMVTPGCTNGTDITGGETNTLEPIIVPTMPDVIPDYLELDPDTGLHMTGEPIVVDFANYRLVVNGLVDHELSLTYDDVRRLPKLTASPELICSGFFVDNATWSGGSLKALLEMAGVQSGATSVLLKGADGFTPKLDLKDASSPDNFLAYELNGDTIPVLHGFPLRAVFPGKFGYFWTKWLVEITVE